MKQVSAILLLLLLCTCIFAQKTKRALIVAIGNYPDPQKNGWPGLSSLNDVPFIDSTLRKQGFAKENIKILTDKNATHVGITRAFNSLIHDAKPGDIVVIHFSSHGEQIQDDNGDETDGLDETIVTYGAVYEELSPNFQKYQEGYLRDDEFGSFIDRLRSKLGRSGDVIVFMDLCHSGTGTRGYAKIRGDKPPMVSPTFDSNKYSKKDTSVFREKPDTSKDESGMATYVVFSAARAEEKDAEMTNNDDKRHVLMGPLSYAISKAFVNLGHGTTYRELFSKIQAIMHKEVEDQTPVMEGNGIDRELFGGQFVYQKPYIEIDLLNGKDMRIRGGLLAGLDTGAEVSVYPAGTRDTANKKALAKGKVYEAHSYMSSVKLNKAPGISEALGWVFITKPAYNAKPIGISIISDKEKGVERGFSESEIANIKGGLKDLPLFRLSANPDLIIVKGIEQDSIKVASNGYAFTTIDDISSNLDKLSEALQHYATYKFLQGLEIKDTDIHIEIKLVPVIDGNPDTNKIDTKIVNGTYEYNNGDKMEIWIKNTGDNPFYFNVLDMQPNGIINAVLPKKVINHERGIYPGDLLIPAHKSFLRYSITVSPPFGNEILKIFVADKQIDLEDLATNRGMTTRGNLGALEKIVKGSYNIAKSRGLDPDENISKADGSTYDLLFRITPKQ